MLVWVKLRPGVKAAVKLDMFAMKESVKANTNLDLDLQQDGT